MAAAFVGPQVVIRHGNALEVLAQLEEASIDAIVTDPPYEIGFMGRTWDNAGIAYSIELWQQALRVLKPGGHLLAFGATRTYHRMAVAIEDAGFEIRDSIHWIYGSGFPKSLNVSKAIDKAAGADREVIATRSGVTKGTGGRYNWHTDEDSTGATVISDTIPATEDAERWDGWGTALKPAHEPIVMARKPLEGTVIANVLEHGTGAINVDGCRVGTSGGGTHCTNRDDEGNCRGHDNAGRSTSGETVHARASVVKPQVRPTTDAGGSSWSKGEHVPFHYPPGGDGRWPANIILSHAPGCVPRGTRKVASNKPVSWQRDAETAAERRVPTSYAFRSADSGELRNAYGDPDGTETIEDWQCDPSCPIAGIDRQSGITKDGTATNRNRPEDGSVYDASSYHIRTPKGPDVTYGGSGGASRFFTQANYAPEDWPFVYQAKPSRKERNAGLDGMPEKRPDERTTTGMGTFEQKGVAKQSNYHPTVKPVALMRHLIRLVTPPGGTVLDPFTGSGTTLVAAVLEGFNTIGIELEDDYLPLIEARVAWAREQVDRPIEIEQHYQPSDARPTDPLQPTLPFPVASPHG